MLKEANALGRLEISMFLSAKKYFYFLIVLCVVLLLIPHLLRAKYSGGFLYGEESYTNLRYAEYVHNNKALPIVDTLSFGGRPYSSEYGLPILFSLKPNFLAKVLPFLFGLFSFIIFYFIMNKLKPEIKGLASLFWIISPTFLYLFSNVTKYGIAVLLTLIGVYLHLKNRKIAALVVFLFVGFFSSLTALLIVICYLVYCLFSEKWENFAIIFIGSVIIFLIQFYRLILIGLPEIFFKLTDFNLASPLNTLFADFGSLIGISFFLFVLCLIGIYSFGKEKYKYLLNYFLLLIIIILIPYFNFLVYYLSIVLVIFAAYGFETLWNYEWKSEIFKYLGIITLCCGLLFTTLAYVNNISGFTPDKDFVDGLQFLKNQDINGTIFSHYTRGGYITYANKKTLMDDNFLYAPGVKTKMLDADRLLSTQNLNVALAIINKYNIEYIWLDKKLIEDLWAGDNIELLFVLKYSPQEFTKIYDNGDVIIYRYKPLRDKNV